MKEVSAAIIVENDKVLLTRRAPDEKLAGYWEFPGGKREENETIEECLVRELFEELSIEVEALETIGSSEYSYNGNSIKLIGIQAAIKSGDIILSVHDIYEWVPIPDLMSFKLAPADISLAKLVQDKYGI